MKTFARVSLPFFLLTSACASYGANTAAFSYRFADNLEEPTRAIADAMPPAMEATAPSNALGVPMAVASTNASPRTVIAWNIADGTELWSAPFETMTRPELLGDVVVVSDRDSVVALSARDGQQLWRRPIERGLAYVGATRDANTIVYVASVGASGGARRVGNVAAVDATSGSVSWEHRIEGVLGKPVARGRYVFVPWERQNIAILGLQDGFEVARLSSTDDVIAWIVDRPEGIYYGWRGIYRFGANSFSGTQSGSTRRDHPLPDAPSEPLLYEDAFVPKAGARSARGRIRLYMSPALTGATEVPVEGDTFYYVYYRYVFAVSAEGQLRWVRILDQDTIAGQVLSSGFLVAGEQGGLRLLSTETGNDVWSQTMPQELASLEFDADGFTPPATAGEPRDLRASLNEIASDPDNRLVPARGYAITLLASLDEPAVTRDLLDLYAQRSMPGALRDYIREATRARQTGASYLVEALDAEYDFIDESRSPPLELIVPSLIESGERSALPGLVRHMLDHETSSEVLPDVVRGVVELGDASIVPALESFLVLYHADSTFREHPEALAIASEGILRHGGLDGRALLERVRHRSSTTEALAASIQGLFDGEQRNRDAVARAEEEAAAHAAEEAARREYAALPLRLSQRDLNQSFATQADAIRNCYNDELARNENLSQVRVVFIVESDGNARDFQFAPNTEAFTACMTPVVDAVEFPRFRERRQSGTVTIAFGAFANASNQVAAPVDVTGGPWWARRQARASSTVVPARIPWWEPRQPREAANVGTATDTERPPGQGETPAANQPWWTHTQGAQPAQHQPAQQQPNEPPANEQPWWVPTE